jgi:molybdopterin-guanine dinucleotide biosynthesis protein A
MTEGAPARVDVVGIVLAGGRASRFGGEKLVAIVDGRTLLARAVEAVASVAGRVVVVASTGAGERLAASAGWGVRDVVVTEDPEPFEGPLAGLAAGLSATLAPLALVAAGDAPWMVPDLLALLVDGLRTTDASGAVLERAGREERFPFAVRTAVAATAIDDLRAAGERRLRALSERLHPIRIPEERWRPLDPDGATFRDVDRRSDLGAFGQG